MQLVPAKKDLVQAEIAYSEVYRFRLWQALVEDMDLMGVGFRAYYTHMFESFRSWTVAGVRFTNARGNDLSLDYLKENDLWGFLGKRSETPTGPARKINSLKIAVIDVFFKKKYPTLSGSFSVSTPLLEMSVILKSFFAPPKQKSWPSQDPAKLFQSMDGVLVARPFTTVKSLRRSMTGGDAFDFVIPVYFINNKSEKNYCIVHKVELPLRSHYIKYEHHPAPHDPNVAKWVERHRPPSTVIYSGLGILTASGETFDSPLLTCILRHRTLYKPYVTTLSLHTRTRPFDDDRFSLERSVFESAGDNFGRQYRYCMRYPDGDTIIEEAGYQEAFFDEIFALKERLGLEV